MAPAVLSRNIIVPRMPRVLLVVVVVVVVVVASFS